nr:uncharacterized protein LOC105466740 [Macaca nemestrina]
MERASRGPLVAEEFEISKQKTETSWVPSIHEDLIKLVIPGGTIDSGLAHLKPDSETKPSQCAEMSVLTRYLKRQRAEGTQSLTGSSLSWTRAGWQPAFSGWPSVSAFSGCLKVVAFGCLCWGEAAGASSAAVGASEGPSCPRRAEVPHGDHADLSHVHQSQPLAGPAAGSAGPSCGSDICEWAASKGTGPSREEQRRPEHAGPCQPQAGPAGVRWAEPSCSSEIHEVQVGVAPGSTALVPTQSYSGAVTGSALATRRGQRMVSWCCILQSQGTLCPHMVEDGRARGMKPFHEGS